MKTTARVALVLCVLAAAVSGPLAQEHSFGLRASTFNFTRSAVFSDTVAVIREPLVDLLVYTRDFDPDDFSGTAWEFYYTWRRDTDAHFELGISAGVFGKDVTETVPGLVVVPDPGDFNNNGSMQELVVGSVENTLEYTLYYVNVTPMYNFTTGKFRFYVGGGLGLWANLWREVFNTTFVNIFTCSDPDNFTGCLENSNLRESAGNRRTILPLTASAGFTYRFRPHWSFNIEDRYVTNAESTVKVFRGEASYSIEQNQVLVGFTYTL
jgi:opacity protein-like surface antigen